MTTARVEVLTAEVRTLQVGNRQVTLSIFRQLDHVEPDEIEPFGRVRDGRSERDDIDVVGRRRATGELVRSTCRRLHRKEGSPTFEHYAGRFRYGHERDGDGRSLQPYECWVRDHHVQEPRWTEWNDLPLIILAGLR